MKEYKVGQVVRILGYAGKDSNRLVKVTGVAGDVIQYMGEIRRDFFCVGPQVWEKSEIIQEPT